METTILKVLRDCKLTDGTQLRLASIQATGMTELSTTRGADNILAKIHLPYSVETAIELMSMGDKLCRIILQDEMGMVEVKDSFK
jgi:hypothetical protein